MYIPEYFCCFILKVHVMSGMSERRSIVDHLSVRQRTAIGIYLKTWATCFWHAPFIIAQFTYFYVLQLYGSHVAGLATAQRLWICSTCLHICMLVSYVPQFYIMRCHSTISKLFIKERIIPPQVTEKSNRILT